MDAIVVTGGLTYQVTYDRDCVVTVVVTGAVLDDAGNVPVPARYRVTVDEPLLTASDHDAGYALAGDLSVALTDRTVPHVLNLTIDADGFRHRDLTVTVPAGPVFPVSGPAALLRRDPVALRGRVLALQTGNPIPGATVTLTGPALPAPQRAVLLTSPLARPLSAATTIRGRSLTPVASLVPIKTAAADAVAGATGILLDDRQGLGAGQLLRLGPPERAHFAEILAVSPTPPNLTLAGLVTLTAPLARTVRLGDNAAPLTVGANVGPTCHLVGEAYAGEGIVILDAQPAGDVVRIADPPNPVAYHAQGVTAGPDGGYVIAGVARLQNPILRAAAAGFTAQNRTWPVRWSEPTTILDWRLAP
jgi:hypothetical protein